MEENPGEPQQCCTLTLQRSVRIPVPAVRVVLSPDGSVYTTEGTSDSNVYETSTCGLAYKLVHHERICKAAFSRNNERLATSYYSLESTPVWSVPSGELTCTLRGHTDLVLDMQFSPCDKYIITASADATARVWRASDGKPLLKLTKHRRQVNAACFSPDGTRILTVSSDEDARVWDSLDGSHVVASSHKYPVYTGAFSPDGNRIVTGAAYGIVSVWNVGHDRGLVHTFNFRLSTVMSVCFSQDGCLVVAGTGEGRLSVWDGESGTLIDTTEPGPHAVLAVGFTGDGTLYTVQGDKSFALWSFDGDLPPK